MNKSFVQVGSVLHSSVMFSNVVRLHVVYHIARGMWDIWLRMRDNSELLLHVHVGTVGFSSLVPESQVAH